jgi:hypothetical protein
MVVLQKRRKQWQCVVIFSIVVLQVAIAFGVQAKKATCSRCFLFCVKKEKDNDNVSLFSYVMLEQRRQW